MRTALIAALALTACGPKKAPEASADANVNPVREMPAPLQARPFTMPEVHHATLSNGLKVMLIENHEVPLWAVRLTTSAGGHMDPAGKEGLASMTFAEMTKGAAGKSTTDVANATKAMGGTLRSGAGTDGGFVAVSGPVRHIDGLLDLWADAILRPDFPSETWDIDRARRVADLKAEMDDPVSIASRMRNTLTWGDTYRGRMSTEDSLAGLQRKDGKSFHDSALHTGNTILIASGDITMDELLPKLEARLGSWNAKGNVQAVAATPASFDANTVYVVDKPGAAQTVLVSLLPVAEREATDHYDWVLGNTVLGGAFTARMNMNLREDKGYTYGARCGTSYNHGPGVWSCSASVATGVTIPAMKEMQGEISRIVGDEPVKADELAYFQSSLVNGFPTRFETPWGLMGELQDAYLYNLPEDHLEKYIPGVQSVTVPAANAALQNHLKTDHVAYLLVGDKASFWDDLQGMGMPVVELNRDGSVKED